MDNNLLKPLQHEQLRYYLFPEEIMEYLKGSLHFTEYTEPLRKSLKKVEIII